MMKMKAKTKTKTKMHQPTKASKQKGSSSHPEAPCKADKNAILKTIVEEIHCHIEKAHQMQEAMKER